MEAGGNFIDTANVYSAGKSEEVVGKWLGRQRRESFVIATKVRFSMGPGPNDVGLSRTHIYAASTLPVSYPYDDAAETQQRVGRVEKPTRS